MVRRNLLQLAVERCARLHGDVWEALQPSCHVVKNSLLMFSGNAGSAFVEVLVGRSSADDFQVCDVSISLEGTELVVTFRL